MTDAVEVRTGARLHFGLFGTSASIGRLGGIGMMIDRPGLVIRAWKSKHDSVDASAVLAQRVADIASQVQGRLSHREFSPGAHGPLPRLTIQVKEAIPPHRGFGSGTQLTFAVAAAMTAALDVAITCLRDEAFGRGERSAVGTVGFFEGGFIVDPGSHQSLRSGEEVQRFAVPEAWRCVVVDPCGPAGPSGGGEAAGFQSLKAIPYEDTKRLIDLVRHEIVTGLAQAEFDRFARGVADFNALVGEHFAPAQGGVYAHPLIRELVRELQHTPCRYLAQSSWGPAAVVFCENAESANELVDRLRGSLSAGKADVFVARPRNRGAEILTTDE
jgi:beta-RFAP synthase